MMCAVLINVIFCSSVVSGWLGSNWRFWYNPYLIVPIAAIIIGTVFVLNFHILLTWISRSLYLLSFSISFVLSFESSGMSISISSQVFSFLLYSTIWGWFASIVRSVVTSVSHIIVVLLTFMTRSGTCPYYLSVTSNPVCLHII